TAQAPSTAPATPSPAPAAPPVTAPVVPAPSAPPAENRPPQRLARVSSPFYEAAVSSEGGKLQELTLKYRGDKPLVIIGELGPPGLVLAPAGNGSAEVVPMDLAAETLKLDRDRPSQALTLSGTAAGLRVRERLAFLADTYTIDARVRIENPTATPQTVTVALPWSTRQDWRETKERFQGQHPTDGRSS